VKLIAAYVAAPPSPERLLVYEYLPGGSLDKILVENMPATAPYRKWELRLRICLDVARGLKYLHHDCHPPLIHRDMKPANVLMDTELVAHLADFGLAKEADMSKTHMSNDQVFGTVGFLSARVLSAGAAELEERCVRLRGSHAAAGHGAQPDRRRRGGEGIVAVDRGRARLRPLSTRRWRWGIRWIRCWGPSSWGCSAFQASPATAPPMREVVHVLDNLEDFASGIKASILVYCPSRGSCLSRRLGASRLVVGRALKNSCPPWVGCGSS